MFDFLSENIVMNSDVHSSFIYSTHSLQMNISYRKYLTSAYEYYQDRTLEEIEMKMPRMHGMKKHVSKVCKGDERMQAIRKTLNELGYERSKMQRQFHDRFIQAVALHLYKDDPDVDLESIMRMNG